MADPFSLVVGIVALIETGDTVIRYLKDARGASKECGKLFIEVCNTKALLLHLKVFVKDREQACGGKDDLLEMLRGDDGPLKQCEQTLQGLESRLEPVKRSLPRALL